MLGVVEGFGIITVIILAGFIFSATGLVDRKPMQLALNRFVFYIGYPCLFVGLLSRKKIDHNMLLQFLLATIVVIVIGSFFALINHFWLKLNFENSLIGMMTSVYLNSNNIGLPVAIYVLKDASVVTPVLVFQIAVLSPIILALLDYNKLKREQRHNMKIWRRILHVALIPVRNPIIIATFAGVALSILHIHIPDIIMKPFDMLGQSAVPTILVAYGMSLYKNRFLQPGTARRAVVVSCFLKTIMMPLVTFFIAKYMFNISGNLLYAVTVLGALPCAQNTYNYAVTYDVSVAQARDTVFFTTLVTPLVICIIYLFMRPTML